MQKLWPLKGSMSLLSMADGFFLLKFTTSEDLEAILSGGPWFLLGKPFILQRWSPKFKPKRDEASPIPIWIKIVDFPLALWTPTGISRIASYIGVPISVDSLTANRTRLTFARVCVLITKDSILHEEIPIEIDGEDLVLPVIYDWKPERCEGCASLIHPFSLCPKNPNLQTILPPQSNKHRGRSTSRHRVSQTRRSPSSKPTQPPSQDPLPATTILKPTTNPIPESNLASSLIVTKNLPLPNLNSPTEVSSSSEHPPSTSLPNLPKIPLGNKFASLQLAEGESSNPVDSHSGNESSFMPDNDEEPPDTSSFDKKTKVEKGKSPAKTKPPKGKSAKKAKPTKY
ncbi:uncharacterized protein LOC110106371 [Dendrobium catenatum]|uniref:RNA exonuclease 1 n=1 Tax=Dendrobium catenatum TaxID=906689 RepID=A0A2I0V883_9ASPA|nr:uncharacterized protein LOC110106371 [Dendrobium catenatum]PKU59626.1 RNA exonuclease 1 [Dendrobium catenatum]